MVHIPLTPVWRRLKQRAHELMSSRFKTSLGSKVKPTVKKKKTNKRDPGNNLFITKNIETVYQASVMAKG